MALSDVVVERRGGGGAAMVALSGLSVAWEVNRAGMLSGRADADELRDAGLPDDLRGCWVRWEHPTAGTWEGFVTAIGRTHDGFRELVAEGFAALLRKRFTTPAGAAGQPLSGTPGALMLRALSDAGRMGPTFLSPGRIDQGGAPIRVEWGRDDVYEGLIPRLTDEIGHEWRVVAGRRVDFARRLGSDRTGSVRLVAGLHVATYLLTDDLWLVENALSATATRAIRRRVGRRAYRWYTIPDRAIAVDQASVGAFGPMEAEYEFGAVWDGATTAALLRVRLAEVADPPASFEGELADVDGCWLGWREGDTVRADLGADGSIDLRVAARAYEADRNVLRVAGEGRVAR